MCLITAIVDDDRAVVCQVAFLNVVEAQLFGFNAQGGERILQSAVEARHVTHSQTLRYSCVGVNDLHLSRRY